MKNRSDAIVALAVIACSIVLLGALLFSISGNPFRKPYLQFTVDFDDLTGIKETSAVLYAGNKVGVVDAVEFLAPEGRLTEDGIIRAYIAITEEVPLPADLDVLIGSESMLGEKHIALRRRGDAGGLLADGSHLSAAAAGSMLESLLPGGGAIVNNLRSITDDLRKFTEGMGDGSARKDIGASLANIRDFTENLNELLIGGDDAEGLHKKLIDLVDKLRDASGGINELVQGPEGAPEEGIGERSKVILANLEEFSESLNATISGSDGEPGLRSRLDDISKEAHLMLAGDGGSQVGLRVKLDGVMSEVEKLMVEIQALIIWGEYVTGTLSEKPSRLIWGSKENDVPTKEEIIEHLRASDEPFPVQIREIEGGGGAGGGDEQKKSGIFKPRGTP